MDWGLRSPLYPAAAAAAANASVAALEKSGVLERGDRVEWVWHDSACDARRVRERIVPGGWSASFHQTS